MITLSAAKKSAIAFTYVFAIVLFIFLMLTSINVNAAVTAPSSVSVSVSYTSDDDTVSVSSGGSVAKGKTVTITASASGGSSSSYYEYIYQYKIPGSTSYTTLKEYSTSNTQNLKLSYEGTYSLKISAKSIDRSGNESSPVTKEFSFSVVSITNTSTISSGSIAYGDSVTIYASGSGGDGSYSYKYSVHRPDDGQDDSGNDKYVLISPSSGDSYYVSSTVATYKPTSTGTYTFKVVVKDNKTGALSAEAYMEVKVSTSSLVNNSTLESTSLKIDSAGAGVKYTLSASGGKSAYSYKVYYKHSSELNYTYLVGSSNSYDSSISGGRFVPTKTGTYYFYFAVKDADGNTANKSQILTVTTSLATSSSVSATLATTKSSITMTGGASGGTGTYTYKYEYKIDDGDWVTYQDYSSSKTNRLELEQILTYNDYTYNDYTSIGSELPGITTSGIDLDNYYGTLKIRITVKDTGLENSTKSDEFTVSVIPALATEYSRQDLMKLYADIEDWECTLSNTERDNLKDPGQHGSFLEAFDEAWEAICSSTEVDYTTPYIKLYLQYEQVRDEDLSDGFFLTNAANAMGTWYATIVTSLGDWLTSFGSMITDGVSEDGSFAFDLEGFAEQFSGVFMIFASSLICLLFGVNIISTAIQYQLFTLKGGVTVFGRLIFAELFVQLSTRICLMIVKIFNELLASIITAINDSGVLANIPNFTFTPERSGIWLIGDIVDFFVNLFPFLVMTVLFCGLIAVFAVVYIKLIIRVLEIAMLIVVSPVFFACAVGESTLPYFKRFISAFIGVAAEIVFMAVVYLAYLWYLSSLGEAAAIDVAELYGGGEAVFSFLTYIAVSVACGVMMIRPPQILRDIVK